MESLLLPAIMHCISSLNIAGSLQFTTILTIILKVYDKGISNLEVYCKFGKSEVRLGLFWPPYEAKK